MNVPTIILIQTITILLQAIMSETERRIITTAKYSKYKLTPAVVNGKPAKEGQFPFLVSIKEHLQTLEPSKVVWGNLCGGSILAITKVLSAAHCFEDNNFYFKKHPGALRVVAGNMKTDIIHDGKTESTENGQWRTIRRVILHQHFHFPNNDIAIALVDEPWVYNRNVKPVRLASRLADYRGNCVSAGYGLVGYNMSTDKVSPIMLTAEIDVVPKWRCSLLWEMNMNAFVCSASTVSDVARGDSGGPLLCRRTGDPSEVDDEGVQVGVVCGKNFDMTTLFTRVSEYKKWIATDGASGAGVALGAAHKLRVSANVYWSIILFVLIYLLFYCLWCLGNYEKEFSIHYD